MPGNRLLVSLKSYIGDAVMTEPLLDQLATPFPSLTVQTSEIVRPLLQGFAHMPGFVPIRNGRMPWQVWAHARELRRMRFDAVILVNRSFRSALTMRLAGIPSRIGHSHEGRDSLLTEAVPYDDNVFEAWSVLDLAPLSIEPYRRPPKLSVSEHEKRRGKDLASGATIAIQPGARFAAKQIPVPVTTQLVRSLVAKGHRVVLVGGPEEKKDAAKVAAALGQGVVNRVGATSIRDTLGLLSNVRVTLGSDTGVLHMAAAAGCPVVQVFANQNAEKWGHAYGAHRVLRAPEGRMDRIMPEWLLHSVEEVLELA